MFIENFVVESVKSLLTMQEFNWFTWFNFNRDFTAFMKKRTLLK